jgi:hypothetical protein
VFGSHDECVQRCAVLVESADDQAFVVAHGTEVGGVTIPGLRRLFELAVGGGRDALPLLPAKTPDAAADAATPTPRVDTRPEDAPPAELKHEQPSVREQPAHITRTLGHHADTPALAPFLGRVLNRRVIRAHDEDAPVDIVGAGPEAPRKARWRMPYSHRNTARAALDEVVEPPASADERAGARRESGADMPLWNGPVSRFHVMARVSVKDVSMWIPPGESLINFKEWVMLRAPGRRLKDREEHTHKWRLVVSAPSYVRSLLFEILCALIIDDNTDSAFEFLPVEDDSLFRDRPTSVYTARAHHRRQATVHRHEHDGQTLSRTNHLYMGWR